MWKSQTVNRIRLSARGIYAKNFREVWQIRATEKLHDTQEHGIWNRYSPSQLQDLVEQSNVTTHQPKNSQLHDLKIAFKNLKKAVATFSIFWPSD